MLVMVRVDNRGMLLDDRLLNWRDREE